MQNYQHKPKSFPLNKCEIDCIYIQQFLHQLLLDYSSIFFSALPNLSKEAYVSSSLRQVCQPLSMSGTPEVLCYCEGQASLLTDTITTIYTITTIMCQYKLNAPAIINVWNPSGPVLLWVASLSPHRHNHHHLHNHHHHVSIHAKCACHQATDLTV